MPVGKDESGLRKKCYLTSALGRKKGVGNFTGKNLGGPHRDNFLVLKNERDLALFGSRGEQRLGVLWLKLGQLVFWEKVKKEKPVLLLDDIFSELDENFEELVIKELEENQVVVSATEARPGWQGETVRL